MGTALMEWCGEWFQVEKEVALDVSLRELWQENNSVSKHSESNENSSMAAGPISRTIGRDVEAKVNSLEVWVYKKAR